MPLIVEFTCELPNGVHARPASHVETLCNTFTSQIECNATINSGQKDM